MENEKVLKVIEERRSIRAYKPDKVPADIIDKIVEAGLYAPSGMGRQSVIIIAITDKDTRDRLSSLNASIMGSDGDPFYGAPAVLVVLADKTRPTYIYDGSLAMGNMLNAAYAMGLGARWIHRAKEMFASQEGKALLKEWGLEGDLEGIGCCIAGYPDMPMETKEKVPDRVVYVD